ncbi:MAG: DUF2235 domain-containing protein [Lentisphaeria bacterium]
MKRLVLCCDGTWNKPDTLADGRPVPSNVVRLAYRVAKRDDSGVPQVLFYDMGVGTDNLSDHITGGVLGDGLEDNIHDAYRFLIGNYEPGDEIFLFGFSRGAFTVRSIGGMIRKCGILRRGAVEQYVMAKELYHSGTRPDDAKAVAFRQQYSLSPDAPIPIKFIGVWDTVGSLGIPKNGGEAPKYQFHDTELSRTVENACHALAIDEHRAPFQPSLWSYIPKPSQKVEQVWFCGAHSDVGGGYASLADKKKNASNIPLQWMLGKAASAGLKLDDEAMAELPIAEYPDTALHDSMTWYCRLKGRVDRAIGLTTAANGTPPQADPTQAVHESVLRRWDNDRNYRPSNLREYFQRTGDPRGSLP